MKTGKGTGTIGVQAFFCTLKLTPASNRAILNGERRFATLNDLTPRTFLEP